MAKKIKVAVVGLGFGAEFVPLYQRHPDAECYAICQRNRENLNKIGDQFGVERRYTKFEDLLGIEEIDAIHVLTPIDDHAPMSLASLKAGKHTVTFVVGDKRYSFPILIEAGKDHRLIKELEAP